MSHSKRLSAGMPSAVDEEDEETTLSTAYYLSGTRIVDRIRSVSFQLLNLMTENKKVSTWTKVAEVLLLVADWLQVVAILLAPVYAWDEETFSWVNSVSLSELLLPQRTQAVFNLGYILAIGLSWLCLLNALYVCYSILRNQYKQIWPLKLLRVLVTTLATAGFIPIMTMLAMPFDCDAMQQYFDTDNCRSWPLVLYLVFSVLTLLLFTPFALLMGFVYFDDNPLSGLPTAKPLGRLDFYDTFMRAAIVFLVIIFKNHTSLLAVITFGLMVGLFLFTNMTLPYYSMKMNQFRSASYGLLVWLSVGSLVTANISLDGNELRNWSVTWTSLSIAAFIGAYFTPLIRYKWLGKLAHRVGNQVVFDKEMRQMGIGEDMMTAQSPHDLYEKRRKSVNNTQYRLSTDTLQHLFAPPSQSKIHNVESESEEEKESEDQDRDYTVYDVIDDEGNAVKPRERRKSLSERHQPGKIPLAELIKKHYLFEYDIEIMVRNLLSEPTRENFTQATVILNAALRVYPDSVFVRVVYSSIILTYASNSNRAVSLLQQAMKLPAPFDLKFLLFTKIHAWNQIRQNQNMGTGKDMVSVIQFKKHYGEATSQHREVIKQISKFWSLLQSDTGQSESLASLVRRIAVARDQAENAYLALLEKYPSNKMVLRSYGLFCLYVKNEEQIAEMYLKKANATGSSGRHGDGDSSTHDGDTTSYGGGSSSMGGSTMAEMRKRASNRRMEIKHEEYDSLRKMKVAFWICIAVLVAMTIGMFVGSTELLDRYFNSLPSIEKAGARRTALIDIWYYTRRVHLAAVNGDDQLLIHSRQELLDAARQLDEKHQDLYFNGVRDDEIQSIWLEPTINVQFFAPGEPDNFRTEQYNLWDLGNFYITSATVFADLSKDELISAETLPVWRFLMDNSVKVVLEAFEEHVSAFDEYNQQTSRDSNILQGAILSVKALVTICLAVFVFRPAIHAVRKAKRGLHKIVERIPRRIIKFFQKRFRAISRIYSNMENADEDTKIQLEQKLQEPKLRDLSKILNKSAGTSPGSKANTSTLFSKNAVISSQRTVAFSEVVGTSQTQASSHATDTAPSQNHDCINPQGRGKEFEILDTVSSSGQERSVQRQHSGASQDEINYDEALVRGGPEENQEVKEEDVGNDAIRDAQMEEIMGNVDNTVDDELGGNEENVAENYGEEVVGEDGIKRVVDKTGLLLPKLSSHNLSLYDEVTGQTVQNNTDENEVDSHVVAASSNASGRPRDMSSQHPENDENDGNESDENNGVEPEENERPEGAPKDVTGADGEDEQDEVPNGSHSIGSNNVAEENRQPLSEPENDQQQDNFPDLPNAVPASVETKHAFSSKKGRVFPTTLIPEKDNEGPEFQVEHMESLDSSKSRDADENQNADEVASRMGLVGLKPLKETKPAERKPEEDDNKKYKTATDTGFNVDNEENSGEVCQLGSSSRQAQKRALSNINLFKLIFKSDCSDDERHIRNLVVKVAVSTIVLCLLYLGNFFITFEVMQQGSFTGSEVNQAERRIFLSSELVNLAQELLIGDGELFKSVNATRDRSERRMGLLRTVHEGIRFGNSTLNLPGTDRRGGKIDDLQYDRGPSAFNITNDPYGETLFSQGVSTGIRFLIQAMELVLGRYGDITVVGEFGDPTSSRPGRNLTELQRVSNFQFMKRLDRQHLRPGLREAGSEFIDRGFNTLEELQIYELLMFLADLLLYTILCATIYRTMSKELLDEGQRSEDVLLLIPPEVVEKTKGLHIFFKGNSATGLSGTDF
eukprot:gb/GECG01012954.1/.p1 GENE.gb/GECG01012954.1/~~gb/GECG01012954.1/.p1  ORF type:complete len:1762 (+),score=243.47 gb/GECG01012954.1/:1-5286(+)